MAYRRKQGAPRVSNFQKEMAGPYNSPPPSDVSSSSSSSASSLAAKAIRASSAVRDSSLSSAYGHSSLSSPRESNPIRPSPPPSVKDNNPYEYTSMKGLGEPKQGFWGALARKAKGILEDDDEAEQAERTGRTRPQMPDKVTRDQSHNQYSSAESRQKKDNPSLQKGLGAIASSLNYIGGTIGNALEEGFTIVENRTADIIQETRKLQRRKKGGSSGLQNQTSDAFGTRQEPPKQSHLQGQMQTDVDIQLKASRDVAMAMAAKAKLLLRELKTVKADLAFAKERCAQLEEENRILRESHGKGENLEDDDLIRLQLETLLAEKARLAQENSVFARENRFLREIVEYHQLTMQDVVYLDEGNEQVTEVYLPPPTTNHSQKTLSKTASFSSSNSMNLQMAKEGSPIPEVSQTFTPLSSYIDILEDGDVERR